MATRDGDGFSSSRNQRFSTREVEFPGSSRLQKFLEREHNRFGYVLRMKIKELKKKIGSKRKRKRKRIWRPKNNSTRIQPEPLPILNSIEGSSPFLATSRCSQPPPLGTRVGEERHGRMSELLERNGTPWRCSGEREEERSVVLEESGEVVDGSGKVKKKKKRRKSGAQKRKKKFEKKGE